MLFRNKKSSWVSEELINQSLAMIRLLPDGTIESANPKFLDLIDRNLDDVKGKHIRVMVKPTAEPNENFWELFSAGDFVSAHFPLATCRNEEVWVKTAFHPVLKKGKVTQIVGITTDMTAQKLEQMNYIGQVEAIAKSHLVIEFNLDGTIITANSNFLDAMGYTLSEIEGRHHRIFADPAYARSQEYKDFWEKLVRGDFHSGEFRRYAKDSSEIWIQASYNPIKDSRGKPFKIVKYASDITRQKINNANFEGQIGAISKSQAVIEFELNGTILNANENFLNALEYTLEEVKGKHHSIFVDPIEAKSEKYREFWQRLGEGHFDASAYKRITKSGKNIWIQATYNPIFDMNGKPFKVVKYASDITNVIRAAETAESTALSVQNVAASIEEMSASVMKISQNMKASRDSANDILKATNDSRDQTDQLVSTTQKMENISVLINNIADQINLLALNANIEAASAGEAGKGFAVVANEVKSLAQQTSQAIEKINAEIEHVQSTSSNVALSVNAIQAHAESVSDKVANTTTAIEEQSIVTNDIAARIQDASDAVSEIAQSIRDLSK